MNPNEQTPIGGEPEALLAILHPDGPDALALAAMQKAKAPAADKRASTAQARAALAGITLHVLAGDDGRPEYIATRWALTKSFTDLSEVERWLDRVGAPR